MNSFIWRKKNITGGGGGGVAANAVTLDTQQTITGDKQFNANVEFNKYVVVHNGSDNDCGLAFYRANNQANYVGFYNGNTRLGYIGKASADNTWLTLASDSGNLKLQCANNSSIDVSSKKIINVANPVNNNDAANKAYVDNNKYGDSWVKIKTLSNISTLNDTWSVQASYQNMDNNFSVVDGGTYEVMIKANINNADIYTSCIVACNAANYDNGGFTGILNWNNNNATPDNATGIMFAIYLKNRQFKLLARRPAGYTNTNWSTNTIIFVRKIAQGGLN